MRFITVDELGNESLEDIEVPGYKGATNNQMELYACIAALEEACDYHFLSAVEWKVINIFGEAMSTEDFPKRLPEKLKLIRERLAMTPDQLAPFVGAKAGAEILAYENDEDDLLVSVLWGYARLANIPIREFVA